MKMPGSLAEADAYLSQAKALLPMLVPPDQIATAMEGIEALRTLVRIADSPFGEQLKPMLKSTLTDIARVQLQLHDKTDNNEDLELVGIRSIYRSRASGQFNTHEAPYFFDPGYELDFNAKKQKKAKRS